MLQNLTKTTKKGKKRPKAATSFQPIVLLKRQTKPGRNRMQIKPGFNNSSMLNILTKVYNHSEGKCTLSSEYIFVFLSLRYNNIISNKRYKLTIKL